MTIRRFTSETVQDVGLETEEAEKTLGADGVLGGASLAGGVDNIETEARAFLATLFSYVNDGPDANYRDYLIQYLIDNGEGKSADQLTGMIRNDLINYAAFIDENEDGKLNPDEIFYRVGGNGGTAETFRTTTAPGEEVTEGQVNSSDQAAFMEMVEVYLKLHPAGKNFTVQQAVDWVNANKAGQGYENSFTAWREEFEKTNGALPMETLNTPDGTTSIPKQTA